MYIKYVFMIYANMYLETCILNMYFMIYLKIKGDREII